MAISKTTTVAVALAAAISTGCATVPSPTTGYTIPEQFQGYWDARACGPDSHGVEAVRIEADHFAQYEGRGQVRLVRSIGRDAIAFTVRALHGDDHWPLNVEARLVSPDVLRFTLDVDEFELNGVDLHRCTPSWMEG